MSHFEVLCNPTVIQVIDLEDIFFLTKKYILHNSEDFYTELYSQMDKDV